MAFSTTALYRSPDCSRWPEHSRVAIIMAFSTTALSRRAVAAVLREETREVWSYKSALKGHAALGRPTPAPRNLHQPTPAAVLAPPGCSCCPASGSCLYACSRYPQDPVC
ncbi:hypothetical protein MRX96_009090 [Rhipicephalus microplus]